MKPDSKSTVQPGPRNKTGLARAATGGETGGVGCRMLEEERAHSLFGSTPRCSRGKRKHPWFYSLVDTGLET